jgi:hypothetical protein
MNGVQHVTATRQSTSAAVRPMAPPIAAPAVGCLFCREPIEIASFVAGPPDPRLLSAACPNCGLLVSATPRTLAVWSRPGVASEGDIAARLRARRVAMGTQAILGHAGSHGLFEDQAV